MDSKEKKKLQQQRLLSKRNFWVIATNSTAAFVLAFLFIFYVNHFTTLLTAGMFNYDVSFNYYVIFYHIEPYQWTHDSVKLMYSAGPILILLVGIISLIAFYSMVEEVARAKIFFVWLTFLSFNYFFGGLLLGNLFTKGVGHVFNWMYLNSTEKMIVALVGFFGLIGTAFLMAKPIAISANSYYKEFNPRLFPFFFTSQIIVPFLIGTVLVELYFLPNPNFQVMWFWAPMIVLLLLIYKVLDSADNLYFDEEDRYVLISKGMTIAAAAVYIGLRVILSHEFYINW